MKDLVCYNKIILNWADTKKAITKIKAKKHQRDGFFIDVVQINNDEFTCRLMGPNNKK